MHQCLAHLKLESCPRISNSNISNISNASQEAGDAEAQDAKRSEKAAEHRAKIADSIRRKWEDPEYRSRVLAGSARAASLAKAQEQSIAKQPTVVRSWAAFGFPSRALLMLLVYSSIT